MSERPSQARLTQTKAHPRTPIRWDEASEVELKILEQAEPSLLQRFRAFHQNQGRFQRVFHLSWALPVLATACFGFWWLNGPSEQLVPTPYEVSGRLEIKPLLSPGVARQYAVNVAPASAGHLSEKDRWSLRAGGGTRLKWSRTSKDDSRFELKRGVVLVHVRPKKMKHFSVKCRRGIQVLVKGTIFSVEQQKEWLRVEVSRGRVQISRKGSPPLFVSALEGVRLDLRSLQSQSYKLSGVQNELPHDRFVWLATREKFAQIASFALDFGSHPSYPKDRRIQVLQEAAQLLIGRARYALSIKVTTALFQLQYPDASAEVTLTAATRACSKVTPYQPGCLSLFRQYLQLYGKDGMSRQLVLWRLAKELVRRRQTKTAIQTLERLLLIEPSHRQARELLSTLQK